MSLSNETTSKIIADYRRAANDTGSPEVQVALLSARIEHLNAHGSHWKRETLLAPGLPQPCDRACRPSDLGDAHAGIQGHGDRSLGIGTRCLAVHYIDEHFALRYTRFIDAGERPPARKP